MEISWRSSVFSHLLLTFFLVSVQAQSPPYTPPYEYFLNCGSQTTVVVDTRRKFTGDTNISFSSGYSREVSHFTNPPSLNDSVRIFNQPAYYEFEIPPKDAVQVHIVRLHFTPFNFPTDLSTALFDVSATGVFLLKNVTATNIGGDDSASIKEFLLRLQPGKFRIYFLPNSPSSIAYVNAIEVFPTRPDFIPSEPLQIISDGTNNGTSMLLSSLALHTIYRINVGGPEIPPNGDRLWRKWQPDDAYLLNPSSANNSVPHSQKPQYENKDDDYFAPDLVYQTAKQLVNESYPLINITWSFHSRKHTLHLLRAHFYDIIGKSFDGYLVFNFYVGDTFNLRLPPRDKDSSNAVPFHIDFLVDSGDSEFVNVSVGSLGHNETEQLDAYLNGVEIMEAMDEHSKDPVIPISDSEEKKHVGLFVGVFGLLCILGCGIFFGMKCRNPKTDQDASHSHTQWSPFPRFGAGSTHSRFTDRTSSSSPIPNLNLGLKFSLSEIKSATNNFNNKFLVGEGGFGKVYRGVLKNGVKVAVKRSQPGAGQGISEFEGEITILSRIRHRHLVSFIGYCDEGLEMILVYEFLEKGTLREHLYNSKFPPLPWEKRLEICIGAARGLHYLHKGSAGGIIHRDIKSTNILLDENLVAKVSDFGLSRPVPLDETHVSTAIKGTFGYLDPEYFRTRQLTEKSDVYSFGVLLLEVLCARPALNPTLPREQINLAEWGMNCKKLELLEEIIDPKLEGQIDPNSLRKFSDTIEKCLQDEDAANRPTMTDVLWDLEYALQLQQSAQARMLHEDSETNVNYTSSTAILRFPSIGSSVLRDDLEMSQDLDTHLTASKVFSQLKADNGR